MKKTLIAISGKIGSGKDLVGSIINFLTEEGEWNTFAEFEKSGPMYNNWEIKKLAGKLKDIVCLILNCTRKQLEDIDFKNTELGEEWWYHKGEEGKIIPIKIPYDKWSPANKVQTLVKLTPRLLLQRLGTEGGRESVHPEIWINAFFADYRPLDDSKRTTDLRVIDYADCPFPQWIITDLRFPNELAAVKRKAAGLTIRVERNTELRYPELDSLFQKSDFTLWDDWLKSVGSYDQVYHASEMGLDNATFDYTIYNDGSIDQLIESVREILKAEEIIDA